MSIKINNILPTFTTTQSSYTLDYVGQFDTSIIYYCAFYEAWGAHALIARNSLVVNYTNNTCQVQTLTCQAGKAFNSETYYKIQIEKAKTTSPATYECVSTFGIAKCITSPATSTTITKDINNPFQVTLEYPDNLAETLKNVEFQLWRKDNTNTNFVKIESSGIIWASYYNTNSSKTSISYAFCNYFDHINYTGQYKIKAICLTENDYQYTVELSDTFQTMSIASSNSITNFTVSTEQMYKSDIIDSGVVSFKITNNISSSQTYYIYKVENKTTNYSSAILIDTGTIAATTTINYEDPTASYGKQIYCITIGNQALLYESGLIASYEDIYLSDAEKILKVSFNPKISNYKLNIQENKQDTLNGAYPCIFRSGGPKYKTFNIEGLLSLHSEKNMIKKYCFMNLDNDNNMFSNDVQVLDSNNYDIGDIYQLEFLFRERVIKWLNNGKYKLFKSPTEGNMIVYLMNVTLAPIQELGRMIYNFSAQVVEIDEFNNKNCKKHNLFFAKDN